MSLIKSNGIKKLAGLLLVSSAAFSSHAALDWHWAYTPADATASNQIASAMNQAVAAFNTFSDYNYSIPVAYNAGVPTAQASYHGWIEFGGSRGWTVAAHEMCHWLGTGTTGSWGTYRNGSTWEGGYANNAAEAYDGPFAGVGCDGAHFWPYGWNVDGGDGQNPERMVGFVGGFVRDQGLEDDRTIGFAPGTYCLRNRVSTRLLDGFGSITDGAPVRQWGHSGNANQQWVLSLIPGTTLFKLRSVATGKYLDTLGNTTDGSAVGQAAENFSPSQQWQVVKTDSGYYKLINMANGKCLDTGGQSVEGAVMQQWGNNPSRNQDWKFINTTLATIPAGLLSQYRPVTASSWQGGFIPESANDGKTGSPSPRWTASGGAYPQWWRVDLGSLCNITNATITWFPGVAFQYRIETSTNDVNWTTAVDATTNAIQGTTTDSFSASARYVRVTVTGVTPSGGWAAFYECKVFGTPQTTGAPGGLAATPVSSQQINLNWADQAGAVGYNLKRSTNNGGPYTTIAADVKGLSYSDAGLDGSTTYYYIVTAVNGGGESGDSIQASATTPAAALSGAPTGLAALPGHNQVLLNWDESAEADSYIVKRGTVNGGPYSVLANPTANTYLDTTAVNGTTYYYVVTVTNSVGESVNSSQVVAAPVAMFAHWKFNESVNATAFDSVGTRHGTLQAGAGWTGGKFANAVGMGGGGHVTLPTGVVSSLNGNFTIATWVYVNANGTWARLFDFGTGTTAYMFVAPVSGGNNVRYAITTSGGGGEQQINGPALSAGAWHHVAVTVSGNTGTLYVNGVVVGTNPGMTLKPSSLGNTTLNFIGKAQFDDPYLNGRVDDFRIYSSALSAAQVAAIANPDGVLITPTGLVASAGHNQADLNWARVPGAGSYNVKRALTSGGAHTTIGTTTAASYTDATAANGTTYSYVVSAVNGAGEGGNSAPFAVTPMAMSGHWKFNETGGGAAADSAGTNTGTLLNGSWAVGKLNNSISLVGAGNSYASLPTGVVSSLSNFTVATWVYVDANRTWARLFDFGTGTGNYMFLAPASGGNTVRYAITTGSGEQTLNGPVLSPAAWHHVAVTLSGTTGTLYVDGVAVGTTNNMTLKPSSLGSTTQNYIGKAQFPDPLLNGRVDDFRLYNRALSSAEISLLFSPTGVVPAAPIGLAATPANAQVSLSWSATAGATGYRLKRSTTDGGPYTTITNLGGTTFTDTGLINGTTYHYVVSAANVTGDGAHSAQASATPAAPVSTTPVNVSMLLSGGALTLSWPEDHTGWRLQAQTNGLATGLSTDWFDVVGSSITNSVSLPVDVNNGSVFYRLVYP
jgi:fibronectin type 3 domain-containing protein